MMHKPIQIKNLSLFFPHKICFENFNCQIPWGSRIGIIGKNGSGKSSLLKVIAGLSKPSSGSVDCGKDVTKACVPQIIEHYVELSGGQRLNKALTEALSLKPNLLLLDEPTNHLDMKNRRSLMRMLQHYSGTLMVVSHDKELLRHCINSLWHIDNGRVYVFSGNYDDYIREIKLKRASIEDQLKRVSQQKKDMHRKLMQEQQRAAKSKAKGEKKIESREWLKMVGNLKGMKAESSQGKKLRAIETTKEDLNNKLAGLRLPEIIVPKFSIKASDVNTRVLVQITSGSVGYSKDLPLLSGINLSLSGDERIVLGGDNGSGKTTLVKAILSDEAVYKTGEWHVVKREDIGYLDQHYATLDPQKTVLETISALVPVWSHAEIRRHLNDFLFRKNEEVNALVSTLSGGEKARLSLAQIAAKTPKLLILDEITNNLDLETKDHVIQVLKAFPGAMVVISHDADFLEEIGISEVVDVGKFK